jgi:hypothetical protein
MLDKREVGSSTPRPLYLSPRNSPSEPIRHRSIGPTEFGHGGTQNVLLPAIEPRLSGSAVHSLVPTLAAILAPSSHSVCRQQETAPFPVAARTRA